MARASDKSSRATDVYDSLRSDILKGRLEPSERLAFASLVSRYNSSVGVIREALQRLTEQGLVESQPQHGFRVVSVSAEDLRDLTVARIEIESLALRHAIADGDTEWEALLIAAHHRLSQAPQYDGDAGEFSEQWAKAHGAFHNALLAGCGNRRILAAAQMLRDAAELYWRWSAPLYDRDRDIAKEHRELMEAALARDVTTASQLLGAHIARTTDKLLVGLTATEVRPTEPA